MTVNGFEQSRHISSLLKGLIRRQRPILFCQPKKIVIGRSFFFLFYRFLNVLWCSIATSSFLLQLQTTITQKKRGSIPIRFFFLIINKIGLSRLMSPLGKNKTRRDCSNPFLVIKWSFTFWNYVPSAFVLNPLDWIWFTHTKSFWHSRFGNLLTMTLAFASFKMLVIICLMVI